MKKTILSLLLAMFATGTLWAWGGQGHSTVAYIAEKHLTPRAKANIESYLNGQSIVYYAAWMDFNRTDPPMDVTRDWHVDYWTDDMRTDANGNPVPPYSVSQIKRIVSEMSDFRSLSDSLVNINIKFLVHLVGDMHCPVHIDFPTSRPMKVKEGKNTIKVSGLEVVSRKRRLEGYNVLFPIGFDAFGLPTENYAIKTGLHPRVVTDNNIEKFTSQLRSTVFSTCFQEDKKGVCQPNPKFISSFHHFQGVVFHIEAYKDRDICLSFSTVHCECLAPRFRRHQGR